MPPHLPQISYLGVMAGQECSEYGFRITNDDKSTRLLILSIANTIFLSKQLLVQEAPDLCYQKALANRDGEPMNTVEESITITESDIAQYRVAHPNAAMQRKSYRRQAG